MKQLFFVLLLTVAVQVQTSSAHINADSMPDSVAEVEYNIYLDFKPDDLKVRNKLGMVYYRLNKITEAQQEFLQILKKEPDNYDALDGMGLVKAAQKEYDEAVKYHKKAMAINPKDMMIPFHLGCVLEKKGMLREAVDAYRSALEKFTEKYPSGTDNQQAADFEKTVRQALSNLETKLP